MCTIMQSLTFIKLMISEKMPMLKFWQAQTVDRPKNMSIISLEHKPWVAQFILCMILMYIATIQHLNYSTQESKQDFAVFISNTPVTLKQSQSHQTYSDNADPEQGYNHAKFERFCFHSVWEKGIT